MSLKWQLKFTTGHRDSRGVGVNEGDRKVKRQEEIGINHGITFFPTNMEVKGETCAEECPSE